MLSIVNPCTNQTSFPFFEAVLEVTSYWSYVGFYNHTNKVYILSALVEKDRFVAGVNVAYLSELMLEVCRFLKDKWLIGSV